MPFDFVCPNCAHRSTILDQFEGQVGPCVNCGKVVTVIRAEPLQHETHSVSEANNNATGMALLVLLAGFVFIAAVGGLIYVTVIPQVAVQRQNAIHDRTRQRLVAIGQALKAYHEANDAFPPATTYDATGKPLHSWRVLILPYLGYSDLYSRYDLTQPWDSEQNLSLTYEMPDEYASASDLAASQNHESSFYVVVGRPCLFPETGALTLSDIQDPFADTILVAESMSYGHAWTEPRDIHVSRMSQTVNGTPGQSFASHSSLGPQVLTADGQVRTLRLDAPSEALQGLATINGGEPISWSAVATD